VVDGDGVIVVGHTRWKAAKHLGLEKVPVHMADLTPEQAKAYRLADNRTALIASWSDDLLAVELAELKALDMDIGSLGFTDVEISEVAGARS
jgi:ParB-like chromosome segregation protein Spo0J